MSSSISWAAPLWKYGDRDGRARRTGTLVLAISSHCPVTMARPRSVTWKIFPDRLPAVHHTLNTGISAISSAGGALGPAPVTPISIITLVEWLPALGVLWHVAQLPLMVSRPGVLRPATPVMLNFTVLKTCSPRAIERRAWVCGSLPVRFNHPPKISKTLGLKFFPNGSLIPNAKDCDCASRTIGPAFAPLAVISPAF